MKKMLVIAIAVVLFLNLVPVASVQAQGPKCPNTDEAIIWLQSQSLGEIIANWHWDSQCLLAAGHSADWYSGTMVAGAWQPNMLYEKPIADKVFWLNIVLWINDDPYGAQCPDEAWFCLLVDTMPSS